MGKVGRPSKVDKKTKIFRLRMTEEDMDKLEKASIDHGLSMSEIVLKGMKTYINLLYFKWKT